jgi:alpha-galactosidase
MAWSDPIARVARFRTLWLLTLGLVIARPHLVEANPPVKGVRIESSQLILEFDPEMRSRVAARFGGHETPLGPFTATETLTADGRIWSGFHLDSQSQKAVKDAFGPGRQWTLNGNSGVLAKQVKVTLYDAFPAMAFFDVSDTNNGSAPLAVTRWTSNAYSVNVQRGAAGPPFWSYQSGSYEKRPNWTLPLATGFHQDNYQGMNADDYGGGTPIVDIWRRDVGIGVGHVETRPKLVSLPVAMPDAEHATVAVRYDKRVTLAPKQSLPTFRTFVTVHQGDYFHTLTAYREFMRHQGFTMAPPPTDGFGPIWCAWGYGRSVQPKQVYDTLPTAKRMGFRWVTLDDGWQDNVGDWNLDPKKWPRGDADMKALVDRIHKEGFKAQLWWSPLSAVPSSQLLRDHPDYALLNEDGSRRRVSWWKSQYLCPADPRVTEYHKALVRKILVDWGFDGLKLDGQDMNGVPACYNPAHHHAQPEASVEALPGFFGEIYKTAQAVKPGSLVEFCPCGTAFSFFTMPHFNMSVASDPESSYQVRSKGKTIKGLMGDDVPYFGDHVELSDGGNDFASTVGVGGVVGTQFVLPELVTKRSKKDMTPEREKDFEKWLRIYNENLLSRGHYIGDLYDIGYDLPETHVIRKEKATYYAFYAKHWDGPVELRGLQHGTYHIVNYETGQDLGNINGSAAKLPVTFDGHLLLKAQAD